MEELKIAQKVWRESQSTVVSAASLLHEPGLKGEALQAAEEAFDEALAICAAAKAYFDGLRDKLTPHANVWPLARVG